MAVFRVERTGDYTVMSNFHLKDKRLSLKASHNAEDIQVLCDEVYEMENGKLCNMNTV